MNYKNCNYVEYNRTGQVDMKVVKSVVMSMVMNVDKQVLKQAVQERKRLAVAAILIALLMLSVSVPALAVDKATTTDKEMKAMDPSKMQGMDQGKAKAMDHSKMQSMEQGKKKAMDHSKMEGMDQSKKKEMDHSKMEGMDHGKMKEMDHSKMEGMDHGKMKEMDHSKMEGMDHGKMKEMDHSKMEGMDHGNMKGMDHSKMQGMHHGEMVMDMDGMQGGSAPPDARDPHAYSEGVDFGEYRPHLADEKNFSAVLLDRFENVDSTNSSVSVFDLQAWYGRDYDRTVIKIEGDIDDGGVEELSSELLWNHAIAAYWNTQAGVRYDSGDAPDRSWAAVGIQGLAPYWFEVDATFYIGDRGRTAFTIEAEYELLFTQRLILQPRIEADFYGKDDSELGIASGLAQATFGLRLRYEIRREIAPYVGVEWAGKFGGTADFARNAGIDAKEARTVAGIRMWF